MRIITPNGLSVDFSSAEIWLQDNTICYRTALSHGSLWTYKSVERAEEVFMEMHKAYAEITEWVFEMKEE